MALGLVMMGFHHYTSPFNIVVVASIFHWIRRIRMPVVLGAAFKWMAGSTFSIYCFHAGRFGQQAIWNWENHGCPAALVACGLFVLGIMIDLPRRILLRQEK